MAKKISKRKSMRRAKIATESVISAVIVALGAYGIVSSVKRAAPVPASPYVINAAGDSENPLDVPVEDPDPNKTIYESVPVSTKDKFKGNLILVNSDYQYFGGDEVLVNIVEKNTEEGIDCFAGNDNTTSVRDIFYEALKNMLVDFNTATTYNDIIIEGGYRTVEEQKALYDEDLANTGLDYSERVALPGHSEHESGYAVDFTTSTEWNYDGTGEYDWINQNCWKYGIILRYPENKTDITKIQYEPWHYRYVGIPHAYFMYNNGICLEEYIDLLRNYTYESEHLTFTDDNGTGYELYFVPSDDGADNTFVPVPNGLDYEISGNNCDGFIVTVYTPAEEQPTTEATTQEQSDAEADEAPTDGENDGDASQEAVPDAA